MRSRFFRLVLTVVLVAACFIAPPVAAAGSAAAAAITLPAWLAGQLSTWSSMIFASPSAATGQTVVQGTPDPGNPPGPCGPGIGVQIDPDG